MVTLNVIWHPRDAAEEVYGALKTPKEDPSPSEEEVSCAGGLEVEARLGPLPLDKLQVQEVEEGPYQFSFLRRYLPVCVVTFIALDGRGVNYKPPSRARASPRRSPAILLEPRDEKA